MSGAPHPALARVRKAVRDRLADPSWPRGEVVVAVSGGADSLALAEAAAFTGRRLQRAVRGLIVDHGLQEGSAEIAQTAAKTARELGLESAEVLTVEVGGRGGPEAAARKARYAALRAAAPPGALILLGHTRDDQAETVLLGLGRGSGPRSLAGMRPLDPPWGRPLLDVPRETTVAACAELGVTPWEDPHNSESRFTRVRLRHEVLPLLEDVLNGGVAAALARTATQLREDSEALDTLARGITAEDGQLAVGELEPLPPALRRRVLRRWLLDAGVKELTDAHLRSVDELVGRWRGQGGVGLPGDLVARRAHGRLSVLPAFTTTKGD
ncbi:tRNA lysidine(34) synthetase TilS [Amycolatopsis sp. CA-230715]|uniref:tRNA lysidine(34) synthetase TilS n=1 Tax=Amycolatopsis sp. CA-230715 TaxID=2745196 RepID=UPI001C00AED7|nr:tRNA lysidine(34) synthetase TilS [Amycolatopsis sp. CA-230715]QWF81429.1 tRNA(Ile)-lysidine synthase [Amycolatopsis sp. CA-230715]